MVDEKKKTSMNVRVTFILAHYVLVHYLFHLYINWAVLWFLYDETCMRLVDHLNTHTNHLKRKKNHKRLVCDLILLLLDERTSAPSVCCVAMLMVWLLVTRQLLITQECQLGIPYILMFNFFFSTHIYTEFFDSSVSSL